MMYPRDAPRMLRCHTFAQHKGQEADQVLLRLCQEHRGR